MVHSAIITDIEGLHTWRDMYSLEMGCQIIHDSIHYRPGWTREYALKVDDVQIGYGSVAVAGPWKDKPTIYEFYVLPHYRASVFRAFENFLHVSGAGFIEVQSNDALITSMLHTFSDEVNSESILFEDRISTNHRPPRAIFRRATREDATDVPGDQLKWHAVVELNGRVVGNGGILFHYNRPYGDIHIEVQADFRRQGMGTFLVQELKSMCYAGGNIPGARCNVSNVASRQTLQKAGFVPCGHILKGLVRKGKH